jgi:hypothetical protein
VAQRDTNTQPAQPGDNPFDERDDLPQPRVPADAGEPQGRGRAQHPHTADDSDLATAGPSDHVEPGTKPERNTM